MSVEIWQPKSKALCIDSYERAISASSVSYYYCSYYIRVRHRDSRQQASRPSSATGPGPGQRRHSTSDYCRWLPTLIIDDRRLHSVDTSCQPVHHYTACVGVSWDLVC